MKHRILFIAALLTGAVAAAQNLHPTVEVTNAYAGKAPEAEKPSETMNVPDSVRVFDVVYDYEVRETDYAGAYDFRPYKIDLRPDPAPYDGKWFYLRAGAGFRFHPEADIVVSPFDRQRFNLNVYGHHRSYVGPYVNPATTYDGYDAMTRAGVDGSIRWDDGSLGFNLGYGNVSTKDDYLKRSINSLDADLHLRSVEFPSNQFYFDILAKMCFGGDNLDYTAVDAVRKHNAHDYLYYHHFHVDSEVGPVLGTDHKILADVDMDIQKLSGVLDSYVGTMSFAPHYIFSHGPWNLRLGGRITVNIGDDDTEIDGRGAMHKTRVQFLTPDAEISFNPWDGAVVFYTEAKGGARVNAYDEIVSKNHFFNPYYPIAGGNILLDNSITRIYASLGFRGSIWGKFRYDLKASYSFHDNSLEQAVTVQDDLYLGAIAYGTYHLVLVTLDYGWSSRSFNADGRLSYSKGWTLKAGEGLVPPAAFSGNFNFVYNYRHRIFAGINADFAIDRPAIGIDYTLPGYFDLGLYGEYSFLSWLSVWAKAGNLIGKPIYRTPFYAQKDAYFTAGVTLNF